MDFLRGGRSSFGTFILEVFSIVFGVMLAVGGNELRQHYNDQKRVEIATLSIEKELNWNKAFLEKRLPYYASMVDTLNQLIDKHGPNAAAFKMKIPGFRGVNPPLLRDSSFKTAISTQAFADFDFTKADQISMAYSFQQTYLKWIDIYLAALFNRESPTISNLRNMFSEMANVGKELQAQYERTLKVL